MSPLLSIKVEVTQPSEPDEEKVFPMVCSVIEINELIFLVKKDGKKYPKLIDVKSVQQEC